jgi:methylthioxylose transferase
MRRPLIALLVALVATLLFAVGFSQRWFPLGVPGQWRIPRLGPWDVPTSPWSALVPAALAASSLAAFVGWSLGRLETMRRRAYVASIVAAVILGGVFQLFLEIAAPTGLHKWANLYHGYRLAARVKFRDVGEVFANHAAVAATFEPNHISANPAGWIAVYRGLLDFFDVHPHAAECVQEFQPSEMAWTFRETAGARALSRSDQAAITAVALMSRLIALLVGFPIAWLVHQRYGRSAALVSASIAMLIPAASLLAPWVDTVYPTFAALIVALSYHASENRRWNTALAAGALVGVGMLFSLCFTVIAALCAMFVAACAAAGWRPTTISMIAAVSGWLLVIALAAAVFGYRAWESWQINLAKNHEFNQWSGCSYTTWLWVNALELAVAMGIPASVFLFKRSLEALARAVSRRTVDPLLVAWTATVTLLDLAGTNRGEVCRLWLFLMPIGVALAVESLPLMVRKARVLVASLLLLQAFSCMVLSRELVLLVQLPPDERYWASPRRLTEAEFQRREGGR